MNESLFIIHAILVMLCGFLALRLGKGVLIAWVSLQAILANLFVIKQMCFFGFHVTCSDVFVIGSALGLNLLREFYGQKAAKEALTSCLFAMVFFVLMAQIHLFYLPSSFDTAHPSFENILSPSPRLLIASLAVFMIVQKVELHFFSFLKEKFTNVSLAWRNVLSVSTTQFLDTVLFSIFGLLGIAHNLLDIIVVSFLIKLAAVALMAPLTHLAKQFLSNELSNENGI